jgi:ABC-2 type transport system ATP-binding protein
LIQTGKILSIDTPNKIVESYPDKLYALKAGNMYALLKKLATYQRTINSYAYGEYAHASFIDGTAEDEISEFLRGDELPHIEIHKTQPTIEDCFIKLLKN